MAGNGARVLLLLLYGMAAALHVQVHGLSIYISADNPNATDNASCWDGGPNFPCKTLNFAFGGVINSTQIIVAHGEYELSDVNSTFRWLSNFTIVGTVDESGEILTVVRCNPNAGLTFVYSDAITFRNVEFSGCGVLHNSTSRNFSDSTTFSFLEFQVGLYFLFCKDVAFTTVSVTNSSGIGVAMYAIGGENSFQHCNFSYNHAHDITKYPGGGGVYIEFPFCSPEDSAECENGTANIPPEYNSNSSFTFTSSSFSFNVANMTHPVEFVYFFPRDTKHLTFGRGGGLSMYFSNANYNSLKIESCTFERNKAVWGGGVFVAFQGSSRGNSFSMTSSVVRDNKCIYDRGSSRTSGGGGGVRLIYSFLKSSSAGNNHISFYNCTFNRNKAFWGGGLSFEVAHDHGETELNTLEFVNCTWMANMGTFGSAVDLSMRYVHQDSPLVNTTLTNCTFTANTEHVFRDPVGNLVPLGAMYVDSIPVQFVGFVLFCNNQHSALAVAETSVDFMRNCTANFTHNSGRNGGAISLLGYAFIRVHNHTHMYFIKNTATHYGGAISSYVVGEHGLVSFGNCFIQYEDLTVQPWNWTTNFHFENNTANFTGGSNSISAMSLLPCVFDEYGPRQSIRHPFCWGDNWHYEGRNCTDEVTSAPSHYVTNGTGLRHKLEVIPGKRTPMKIRMVDDQGHDATDIMVVNAWTHSDDVDIANSSLYISSNTIVMFGQPNTTATVDIQTIDPRVVGTEIDVTLLPCPPGLIPQKQEDNLTSCSCGGTYAGTILCSSSGFEAALLRGSWMGYYNESGKEPQLVVGMCVYTSSQMPDEHNPLPENSSALDVELCAPVGRTGVLCGNCIEGHGPALNSRSFQCINCTNKQAKYQWTYYVLNKYLPITIFFFITLLFNVSVTRGTANAFVFFAQLLTTTFDITGDGTIPLESITNASDALEAVYIIPYEIWNLNFLTPVLPQYCLSPYIDTLTLIALEYLVAAYPLFLILMFYAVTSLYDRGVTPVVCLFRPVHKCFATLKRSWNVKRSTVDAFATFLVLSYTKFTIVSIYLINSVALYDNGGSAVQYVVYYNGNVVRYSREHIPYLLLAIFVLIVFVILPPLLLLVYPLKLIGKISSWTGCGRFFRIQAGGRMQMFLDTFQGCYKDGTEGSRDCRYFAGVYFLLRTVLFAVYAYTGEWFHQYVVQQLVCTIGILLFATIRPYKNNNISNLDAIIFGLLAAINVLSLYNSYLTAVNLPLSTWAFTVQYILIFIPLFYMVTYVVCHIWNLNTTKKVLRKLCCCFLPFNHRQRLMSAVSDFNHSTRAATTSTIDDDFLEYTRTVEACGRDRERNTYRPSSASCSHEVSQSSSGVHQSTQESTGTSERTPFLTTLSTNKGASSSSGYDSIPKHPPSN